MPNNSNPLDTPSPWRRGQEGETKSIISDIKAELRANMNGVASKMMRDAGMTADYRVNFGIEIPRINYIASEVRRYMLPEDADGQFLCQLGQALWKESVRECRILATILYPPLQMDADLADIWVDQIRTVEMAQITALNLFSKIPSASVMAFRWIASDQEIRQLCGFYTLFHLLRNGQLSDRSADELSDQAEAALASDNPQLRMIAQRLQDLMQSSADNQ